jgi:ABC-2 type transport system permease protein
MPNKTLLVAQREYLENIRTKTFWIGILAFPLLIAISIGAGFVLNKLKQTQSYAVLDLGDQRLGERIERQARNADAEALARLVAKFGKDDKLPAALEDVRRELPEEFERLRPQDASAKELPAVPEAVAERMFAAMMQLPATDLEQFGEVAQAMATARKFQRRTLADLEIADLPVDQQRQRLAEMVEKKQLFAFFVVGARPIESVGDFEYVSNNFTDSSLREWYGAAATRVVQSLRIADAKIPRDVAQRLKEEVRFAPKKAKAGETADVTGADKGAGYAPVAFVYMLWVAVFTAAQMLLTNTVEEKSNRIIEVLLSSVSPQQLMAGKIWGIGATGLTLTVSWALCALLGLALAERLIPGADLSAFAAAQDPLYLTSFVVYFLLGYLLYAAILVGLGSVTNSLKEAQNLLQPVFVILVVPLVSMMFIMNEPNGLVAKVLSYIPLFTPFVMMNRAGGPPEVWEYVATGVLLLVSVWLAFKAAAKIFRVGVLMTGNPPKLKEILGWLRQA